MRQALGVRPGQAFEGEVELAEASKAALQSDFNDFVAGFQKGLFGQLDAPCDLPLFKRRSKPGGKQAAEVAFGAAALAGRFADGAREQFGFRKTRHEFGELLFGAAGARWSAGIFREGVPQGLDRQ